ncbi:MAG: alpha/beta fold hydrolase [Meiothermus silvanus]|nr:alpha/beta fold hydrolase [Allomeiothermus silvanus]
MVALRHFSKGWIVPPRVVLDPPPCDTVEEVHFASEDGTPLYGWLLRAGEDDPALLLCHGYQRSIEETFGLAFDLREHGYNVMVFDFRGCGRSGGRYTTIGHFEPLDARAALHWLVRRTEGRVPVGMLGISMGGSVAFAVMAGCPEVRALVTDSAFATLMDAVQQRFKPLRFPTRQLYHLSMRTAERMCGGRVHQVRPVDAARRIGDRPVLLIHGTADTIVPYEQALILSAALTGPHELWTLEGVGHAAARFCHRKEYLERVTSFFARHLRGAMAAAM